jgi:hypothetical protein
MNLIVVDQVEYFLGVPLSKEDDYANLIKMGIPWRAI